MRYSSEGVDNILNEAQLLYFYSTIPQVLGAIIAIVGALLIFKFQSINNALLGFGSTLLITYKDKSIHGKFKDKDYSGKLMRRIEMAIAKRDYIDLYINLESARDNFLENRESLEKHTLRFKELYKKKKKLLWVSIINFIYSGLITFLSILMLTIIPH